MGTAPQVPVPGAPSARSPVDSPGLVCSCPCVLGPFLGTHLGAALVTSPAHLPHVALLPAASSYTSQAGDRAAASSLLSLMLCAVPRTHLAWPCDQLCRPCSVPVPQADLYRHVPQVSILPSQWLKERALSSCMLFMPSEVTGSLALGSPLCASGSFFCWPFVLTAQHHASIDLWVLEFLLRSFSLQL